MVALNLYSHFSGSDTERMAFSVPQERSTLTERIGPFQHFALLVSARTNDSSPIPVLHLGVVVQSADLGVWVPADKVAESVGRVVLVALLLCLAEEAELVCVAIVSTGGRKLLTRPQ